MKIRKLTSYLVFVGAILLFSSCGLKVSSPGKSQYTNHKRSRISWVKKAAKQSASQEDDEENILETVQMDNKNSVSKKIRKANRGLFAFVLLWLSLAIASPIVFFTALRAGWASWAVVTSGVVMGVVWVFTIWVLIAILIFMFAPRRTPMVPAYG